MASKSITSRLVNALLQLQNYFATRWLEGKAVLLCVCDEMKLLYLVVTAEPGANLVMANTQYFQYSINTINNTSNTIDSYTI